MAMRCSDTPAALSGNFSRRSLPPYPIRTYDPQTAEALVLSPRLVMDRRFWELAGVAARLAASAVHERVSLSRRLSPEELKQLRARRLKQAFLDLGPTFIKVAQFLSTRRDLLPAEVAQELSTLQDSVPPFASDLVAEIIEADLGAPPQAIFASFEREPFASASIGQVHRARLKDGSPVVVKVQRPDLPCLFYRDLGYMRLWARSLEMLGKGDSASCWLELADEIGRTLFSEIDYIQEGKNADKLRRQLRHNVRIRIPRVHWRYTGRRVLTLEYISGTKIDRLPAGRARGVNRDDIGTLLVRCYLDQIVNGEIFHADPHAGNLAVDESGNLIMYDFGMVGALSAFERKALLGCVTAVVAGDAEAAVAHLVDLGVIRKGAPTKAAVRAIKPLLDYYAGQELLSLDFTGLERDVDQLVEARALGLPPSLAYLIRAGSSVEGLARTLDPNFSFIDACRPVVRRWAAGAGAGPLAAVVAAVAGRRLRQAGRPSRTTAGRSAQALPAPSGTVETVAPAAGEPSRATRKAARRRALDKARAHLVAMLGVGLVALGLVLTAHTPAYPGQPFGKSLAGARMT